MSRPSASMTFTKLVVDDLEKAAAFYKAVFGLKELRRVESEIGERAVSEIIFEHPEQGSVNFLLLTFLGQKSSGQNEVIVGVTTDDAAGFVAQAQSLGGQLVSEPKFLEDHGLTVAFVKDPEGHLLEVVQFASP